MNEREFLNLVAQDSSFLVAAHEMKTPLSIIRQPLTLTDNEIDLSEIEKEIEFYVKLIQQAKKSFASCSRFN